METKKLNDLSLNEEETKELENHYHLAYKIAHAYSYLTKNTIIDVDDLAQNILIDMVKAIKQRGVGNNYYVLGAKWTCLNIIKIIHRRRGLAKFISINNLKEDEDYIEAIEYTPDYDKQEVLECAMDFISSLPEEDRNFMLYLCGLDRQFDMNKEEALKTFNMGKYDYWLKRNDLLFQLRNDPRIKEILQCQT